MTLRTIDALAARGFVEPSKALEDIAQTYSVALTPHVADLVSAGGKDGGIGRQFLPTLAEAQILSTQSADPIADKAHEKVRGLIHRYPDRVLLKATHTCPVYCRFCFRRAMVGPGGEAPMTAGEMDAAIAYIAKDSKIFEVILTGGDPLMLPAKRIEAITQSLARISHVQVLRWHSRVPTVDPARITEDMVRALMNTAQAVYVAVHANHPDEFGPKARAAIARLAQAGIGLIGQTVLLKGINDEIETLEALMRAFVANRIKPYYLHQMDPAPGAAHFEVPVERGRALITQLRDRMTGLGVPAYVADGPEGRKRHLDAEEIER